MSSGRQNRDPAEVFLDAAQHLAQPLDTISEDDRAKVLLNLYELTAKIESPRETFMRVFVTEASRSLQVIEMFPLTVDSEQ
ncbi:O-methyltransferase [Colletotrichum sojae]|uniref:O-methyltransferase n=1 Tax=Colletotrichum sojae TaxID=2175907 RepID=A0A8H6J5L2_9PEZI|nr:O-methyltransferase [Colletotrichum sojae]